MESRMPAATDRADLELEGAMSFPTLFPSTRLAFHAATDSAEQQTFFSSG